MSDPISHPRPAAVEPESTLVFNGVSAYGGYLHKPLSTEGLTRAILGTDRLDALEAQTTRAKGPIVGVDVLDLASSGWGVIFHQGADPAIRKALDPLLRWRQAQAGDAFRNYHGEDGFQPGENALGFLERHGAGPGCADPEQVPYYLLLVGGPEAIPFSFQSDLTGPYAVGRLDLNSVEGYAAYARAVVRAEKGPATLERRAAIFGVRNPDDIATNQSCDHLARPLAEDLANRHADWTFDAILGEEAHRQRLVQLFGEDPPALLFTASHGVGFPCGDPVQRERQGALLCSDWRGPEQTPGPVGSETYITAADLPEASLPGGIAFHFACYGGGTPERDAFDRTGPGAQLAPAPFVARLPQRLLESPGGGALAVIGHVERVWGYSFLWKGVGRQTQAFRGALSLLMQGAPVGAAMDAFAQRGAALGQILLRQVQEEKRGGAVEPRTLAALWTASTDTAGYSILGDPAVRLSLKEPRHEG